MTTNGILGGQYVQPVTEWIFPEVIIPGATQPELGFDNIAPLANGFGPDDAGNVFHQLSPWPGTLIYFICSRRLKLPITNLFLTCDK